MKNITNITVDSLSSFNERAAAGWQDGEARYHVWFEIETKEIETGHTRRDRPTIYKNPLRSVDRTDPAYFETRYLDASAPKNAAILKHVFEVIERDGLIAKALAKKDAEERQREADAQEVARQRLIEEAGPELLEALKTLAGLIESGMLVNHSQLCSERRDDNAKAYEAASSLIARLDAKPADQPRAYSGPLNIHGAA